MLAVSLIAGTAIGADSVRVTLAARSMQPGELVVVTIVTALPAESLHVRAFNRDVPTFAVGKRTRRALVGIDLDVHPGTYPLEVEAGDASVPIHVTREIVVRPKTFPTRTLEVNEAYVNPPAELQARITREAEELRHIWQSPAPERLWSGPFVRPVPGASVSGFGRRSVFNGQPRNAHGGADFRSAEGTPIHAPNAGRVVLARDLYFSGNTIIIDHGLGLFSLLAHLSAFDVREGDTVTSNQVVGRVGATGRVTGPHLHWAVRVADARVDPLALLALLGGPATP